MIARKFTKFCLVTTTRKHSINHILKQQKSLCGEKVNVKGWVHTHRALKNVTFLGVNDGSCLDNIQVVVSSDCIQHPVAASYGTSVSIAGVMQESQGAGQKVDLLAERVDVLGRCQIKDFPLKSKKPQTQEYIRQFLHLRSKTKSFSTLLRLRNALTQAIHQTLQADNYVQIDTPILTSNDCEGAGEVFQVEPANKKLLDDIAKEEGFGTKDHFFGSPVYLTVSGQLHLEAVASGFTKVYTLGPTFRAENSRGRHHLSEFYMLEAELSFVNDLETLLKSIESTVHNIVEQLLMKSERDIHWHWQRSDDAEKLKELVKKLATRPFIRMTYDEAIIILNKNSEKFRFLPKWGCDLQKEHERFLVEHCGDIPVFVTNYPADIKPFYMRQDSDTRTVGAVDLLVSDVGELCGGSLRETNLDILQDRHKGNNGLQNLEWYFDLRRFGSVEHGGYGLGVERLLMAVTGLQNIRDVIPFPRSPNNCKL